MISRIVQGMVRAPAAGVASVVLSLLLLGAAWPGVASDAATAAPQAAAQPQMIQVTVVEVKPDSMQSWREFQKTEVTAALKKVGSPWRAAWRTAVFGNAYEYVFVSPIEKFAQFDEEDRWSKALGEEKLRALVSKSRSMITGHRRYAVMPRPDLGYEGSSPMTPKLMVVMGIRVSSGRRQDFEGFIRNEIVPVLKKAGIPSYSVSQTVLGGDINEYVALAPIESFADLDKEDPLVRVLGREGATKLVQKTSGMVESVERMVVRLDTELSYGIPAAAQTTNEN